MRKPVVIGLIVGVVALAFSTLLLGGQGGKGKAMGPGMGMSGGTPGGMPHGAMEHGKMPHGQMEHGPMGQGGMGQAKRPEQGNPEEGRAIYERLCVTCHGASGKGDGPTGKFLTPRPSSFAQHISHHGEKWSDYYFKIIKDGARSVGRSPLMAAWGGRLKSEEIWDVIGYIWTLVQGVGEPADKGHMLHMHGPGGGK
ncbi:cytochrome c [Nitrospinae bacterium AH_259_B05_G02_I21]|nr:cytochrome c [Nitrospinae bacterium AH_259_B05_G02_I21]MDA2932231.1 cytochrome c [Nitrospinae bacterium AH-259-F20]